MSDQIEFENLPEMQKNQVISSAMNMLQTLTLVFGLERGQKLFESIKDGLGQDIYGAVFFSLLTGNHGVVVMHDASKVEQYVNLIKVVRSYTGFGLKEAKDICDLARAGQPVKFDIDYKVRSEFIRELNNLKAIVS